MAAAIVGYRSAVITGSAALDPAMIFPFQYMISGTLMPPSYNQPFPAFKGALDVGLPSAVLNPPLSDVKITSVLSSIPNWVSLSSILPMFASMFSIIAAYTGLSCCILRFQSVSFFIHSSSLANLSLACRPNCFCLAWYFFIKSAGACKGLCTAYKEYIRKKGLLLLRSRNERHSLVNLSVRYSPAGPSGNLGFL